MIIRAIDVSASVRDTDIEVAVAEIEPGDFVVSLEAKVVEHGLMRNRRHIGDMVKGWRAYGGIGCPLSELFAWLERFRVGETHHAIIYTDGFLSVDPGPKEFMRRNPRIRISARYVPYFYGNPLERMLPPRKEYLIVARDYNFG